METLRAKPLSRYVRKVAGASFGVDLLCTKYIAKEMDRVGYLFLAGLFRVEYWIRPENSGDHGIKLRRRGEVYIR